MKGDKKMNYAIDKTQKYPYLDGMYRLCKDGVGIGWIGEGARIGEGAWIGKGAWISEGAWIGEGARNGKGARIGEGAWIGEGAEIKSIYDYLTVGGIGSRKGMTTFYRCKDGLIRVNCGCFNGTLDEFEAAVHETHAGNEHEKAYMAAIRMAKEIMIHD